MTLVLIFLKLHGAVHDVVHAGAEGHPRRLLAEHVLLESAKHMLGCVSTDAGRDDGDISALGGEAAGDQAHITAGVLCAKVGRVLQEGPK
jgi:hypothetical protein